MDQGTAKVLFGEDIVRRVLSGEQVLAQIQTKLGTFNVLLTKKLGRYAGSFSEASTIKVTVLEG